MAFRRRYKKAAPRRKKRTVRKTRRTYRKKVSRRTTRKKGGLKLKWNPKEVKALSRALSNTIGPKKYVVLTNWGVASGGSAEKLIRDYATNVVQQAGQWYPGEAVADHATAGTAGSNGIVEITRVIPYNASPSAIEKDNVRTTNKVFIEYVEVFFWITPEANAQNIQRFVFDAFKCRNVLNIGTFSRSLLFNDHQDFKSNATFDDVGPVETLYSRPQIVRGQHFATHLSRDVVTVMPDITIDPEQQFPIPGPGIYGSTHPMYQPFPHYNKHVHKIVLPIKRLVNYQETDTEYTDPAVARTPIVISMRDVSEPLSSVIDTLEDGGLESNTTKFRMVICFREIGRFDD